MPFVKLVMGLFSLKHVNIKHLLSDAAQLSKVQKCQPNQAGGGTSFAKKNLGDIFAYCVKFGLIFPLDNLTCYSAIKGAKLLIYLLFVTVFERCIHMK